MSLSSLSFLLFLGISFAIYLVAPPKFRVPLLLVLSCGFYLFAMPGMLLPLLIYTLLVYVTGELLRKIVSLRKAVFVLLISLIVLFLAGVKYLDFLLGLGRLQTDFSLLAPLGISYVTFQAIAYLTGIYQGKTDNRTDLLSFALYLLYFPKITAGPIEEPVPFLEQVRRAEPSWENTVTGGCLILSGFLKKCVTADLLAPAVSAVFDSEGALGSGAAVLGALLYSVEILADFSGYTDIARGASFLFGIRLTENFRRPYLAEGLRDFWRRWHISLSAWLKNYIYIPLGGNRKGKLRKELNVLVTFTVSGIWHGAGWTFLLWGLLHGLTQAAEDLLSPVGDRLRKKDKKGILRPFRVAGTFLLVTFFWIFFRAADLSGAFRVIRGIFGGLPTEGGALAFCGVTVPLLLLAGAGFLLACGIVHFAEKSGKNRKPAANAALFLLCALGVFTVILGTVLTADTAAGGNFIYMDF